MVSCLNVCFWPKADTDWPVFAHKSGHLAVFEPLSVRYRPKADIRASEKKPHQCAGFCLASTWPGRPQAYPYYWVYLNE